MAHRVCGLDNGYEAKMDALLCQLTNGKFSKSRDYSLEFMAARIEEEYELLYANNPLTVAQVRKAIYDCSTYASYDGCTYYASGIRLQAITDELNDELESGMCNPIETETLENVTAHVMECDKCGHTYEHVNGDYKRCPYCGKLVKR